MKCQELPSGEPTRSHPGRLADTDPKDRPPATPVVAKSGAESEAQRQRVAADRATDFRIMSQPGRTWEPQPSVGRESWRAHAGVVDESFFWSGTGGPRMVKPSPLRSGEGRAGALAAGSCTWSTC